jgi:two-component system chemotaxis response regulator CheY
MRLNILVVDDSGVMRKMVLRALTESGLDLGTVFEAANGREGLAVIEREMLDVVLLDIHMPVMTGEELFMHLKSSPKTKSLPVVFISSESSSARIETLMERGAGFIHKPWSAEDFRAQILAVTGAVRE